MDSIIAELKTNPDEATYHSHLNHLGKSFKWTFASNVRYKRSLPFLESWSMSLLFNRPVQFFCISSPFFLSLFHNLVTNNKVLVSVCLDDTSCTAVILHNSSVNDCPPLSSSKRHILATSCNKVQSTEAWTKPNLLKNRGVPPHFNLHPAVNHWCSHGLERSGMIK